MSQIHYNRKDSIPVMLVDCVKLIRESLTTHFEEAGFSVTAEQWGLFLHLWEEDGLPQQILANRYARSKVAIQKLLEKMEKKGYVRRKPNPDDGRSKLVFLTAMGRKLESQLVPLAMKNIDKMIRGFTAEELSVFRSMVRRLSTNLA